LRGEKKEKKEEGRIKHKTLASKWSSGYYLGLKT